MLLPLLLAATLAQDLPDERIAEVLALCEGERPCGVEIPVGDDAKAGAPNPGWPAPAEIRGGSVPDRSLGDIGIAETTAGDRGGVDARGRAPAALPPPPPAEFDSKWCTISRAQVVSGARSALEDFIARRPDLRLGWEDPASAVHNFLVRRRLAAGDRMYLLRLWLKNVPAPPPGRPPCDPRLALSAVLVPATGPVQDIALDEVGTDLYDHLAKRFWRLGG